MWYNCMPSDALLPRSSATLSHSSTICAMGMSCTARRADSCALWATARRYWCVGGPCVSLQSLPISVAPSGCRPAAAAQLLRCLRDSGTHVRGTLAEPNAGRTVPSTSMRACTSRASRILLLLLSSSVASLKGR